MMPLWTTAILPFWETCGWELISFGSPWVAQRVWPMPSVPGSFAPPSVLAIRFCRRPLAFATSRTPFCSTQMPAES